MLSRAVIICLFAVVLFCGNAAAQNSAETLRTKISQLEKEIKAANDVLQKTLKDKKLSQSELKVIQNRIRNRREMVATLEQQLGLLENDIQSKSGHIGELNSQMEQLRREYADMIRAAYKNHKLNNFLLFLFAAEDFNDAVRRVNFMRRYNIMRTKKAQEISAMTDSITAQVKELDRQREELSQNRKIRTDEIALLGKDETQYKSSVTKLQQQESKISKELKAKQAEKDKAMKRLNEILAEEARKARNETRTAAEDRQIAELSGKFEDNKGKMPYPIRSGVITDRFGTHRHPTQANLTINNPGINMSAAAGSQVNCVFEGEVSAVFPVPGMNNCVMVRHGNYFTVYANLVSVAVRKGDKIRFNQLIGRVSDSNNPDEVYLHFEVWKDTTRLNPEHWIRR